MIRLFQALFFLSLPFALWSFLSTISANPHGGWDAWAIWNMHAKFLAFGGADHWRDYTQLWWTHPDYPLLLPALVATGWKLFGYSIWVPATIAAFFTFGTVVLLIHAVKGWQGYAAGIALLSCHLFITCGASEYADEPLGFFLLATTAAARADKWLLAGVCAGLCAMTKQEGAIVVVAFLIVLAAHVEGEWALSATVGAGVLWIVTELSALIVNAPHSLISTRSLGSYWALFADPARWEALAGGLWRAATGPFLVPAIALGGGVIALRPRVGKEMVFMMLIWAGYMLAIILSPFEIGWQLSTALTRLLMQLLPAALFIALAGFIKETRDHFHN